MKNDIKHKMLSLMMCVVLIIGILPPYTISVRAAESTSGTDQNGFSWTSDGTSVTITGYNPSKDSSLFYGIEYNGHYYGLSVNMKTWTEAKADCEANGGHLVTITDEEEQMTVQKLFSYDSSTTAWIGATDEENEGEWTWCTGEEFSYTNWKSGEPNNDGDEDYAGIYIDNFKWNDWKSSQALKYICEWEELPPEDVFSEYKFYGLEYNGHYYGLSQNKLSWEEAKTSCEEVGGKLVSINTEDEQALLERLLGFAPSGNRWIGAYKADGLWQWVDGEVIGYNNWDPGEPSGNGDTAVIYYGTNNNHDLYWDDCSGSFYYICEWDKQPAEDAFVISLVDVKIPSEINGTPVTAIADSAFKNNKYINSVIIPDSVMTIGSYAFQNCTNLTVINLANSITTIKYRAFQGCTGLTSIELPSNITTMGDNVFNGCTGIKEIEIPAALTTAECAFAGSSVETVTFEEGRETTPYKLLRENTALKTVILPSTLTSTGNDLFYGCTSLEEVVIPENVTSLGGWNFKGCTTLKSVSLPDGLLTIGEQAFANCTNLTTVNIPSTVETINNYAFWNCYTLTELNLPNSVTTINYRAFEGCTGLSSIILPSKITTMGDNVFNGCTSITEITIPESLTTANETFSGSSIETVTFEEGRTTTPYKLFTNAKALKTVMLPNSLTSTGNDLFYGCTSLEEITIPNNVTSLGGWNFKGCTALKKISLPEGLLSIGEQAFCGCTNLTELNIPRGLTTIGSNAFNGCSGITEITIPATLKNAEYAFANSCIVNATFEEGMETTPFRLFHSCSTLTTVTLPSTLKSTGADLFHSCPSLENVIFQEGLESLGNYAFYNCKSLKNIDLPNTLTSMGTYVFYGCSGLADIIVPAGIDRIQPYTYGNCTGLTSIEIPSHIKAIYHDAFNGCKNLTNVKFNEGLEVIGYSAFNGTAIEKVTIPKSVWMMSFNYYTNDEETSANRNTGSGASAFYGSRLKKVTFAEGATRIPWHAFYNCNQLTEVILPESIINVRAGAFQNCTNIVNLNLPDAVTTIEEYAFYGCTGLTDIIVPSGIDRIQPYTYGNCTGLTSIEIPSQIKAIYHDAFNGCSNLNEVVLNDGLLDIGYSAFRGTAIKDIVIPKTTDCFSFSYYSDDGKTTYISTSDNASAFYGANELKTVTFADGSTIIGKYSFYNCKSITQINIPKSVTTIKDSAFRNCTGLTSIDIPESVTSIGEYAFYGCTGLTDIIVPAGIDRIQPYTYGNCTGLTSIEIPSHIKAIYHDAFNGCKNLTDVNFNEGLEVIGYSAFNGTAIEEVVIPKSVWMMSFSYYSNDEETSAYRNTGDGASAFYGSKLKKITFTDGETRVPWHAFKNCKLLTEVNLSDGIIEITDGAFQNCTELTSIDIPQSVITISNDAFNGCSSLKSLNINAGSMFTGYKIEAENVHITSGNPKWESSSASGGYCVDYAYDLDFDVNVTTTGTFLLTEYAAFNDRSFKLYVDNELIDTIKPTGSNSTAITKYDFAKLDLTEGSHNIKIKQNSGYTPIFDYFVLKPIGDAVGEIVNGETFTYYDGLTSIGTNAFTDTVLTDVYYTGTEEQWNTISVSSGNDPLKNATFHFGHTHAFGEWEVDYEPTCAKEGKKHKICSDCGYRTYEAIDKVAHTYEHEVVPPTYLEQGYTLYTCFVCGDTYKDIYVDPLERIDLSNATLELEYNSVYYEGLALTPDVTLTYEGETYDSSKELKITYTNNNQVGTATVTIEGINRFKGTVELQFEISYEVIPEQIVNVIAIGEIGKVSLSWGESSEVNTDSYNIYRKASDESNFRLIKTVNGRENLSYEDSDVEKEKTYFYYVTGVGLYGAESIPSEFAFAIVQTDKQAPTILKVSPAATSVIAGKTTLSATTTDNIGVKKVAYFYTLDNGENWVAIGETTNKSFSIVFDTTDLDDESVKVKALAYDAEGNESEPITVVYSLDNVGPEKVTGLSGVTLSSKITLSWNDVTANDAAYFILQTKSNEEWATVATKITTLGYTVTGLQPDTDYIYRVACVDTHGNIGEYSDEFTSKTALDKTAPVITSQSPNSARYNSIIKFSATAKDDCDVKTIEIQVSTDLSSWTTISTNTYTARTYRQTYTYTIDLSSYAEGSIFVRAIATDFTGNISDTSDAAPYTEYIIDKTAPEAPTGVSANGNDGYITVSWTMGSEADLGKYFVYKSTSLNGNYQLVASNLSSLNYHDRDVQSGREFFYKVKVSDTCGNMSEYSNAASATMSPDTQSPEITSISSTYQQKISSTTHTINVAANDNNKLSYIVVEYCTSINPEYTQLVVSENIDNHYKSISVTLPIDGLADGDVIHLRAYAVDMAGLQSEYATAKYTLDTTPPMVEDYTALLDVSTVYLDWKDNRESDLSGFKVYRSVDGETFTLLGSRGVSSTGAYSFIDTITDKESNTYIYKLESIDRLGNTASWLKSVDYTYVYVNQIPIAQMVIPDFMTVGVEEIFDASGSTDDIVIMSYLWDFGDGTTSTEMKPVKSYDAVGTYTVKLSVTDNEGITSTITKDIEVKERDLLGTLNVKVVDENGKALSYVPVYFDLGSDNQKIIYTNASGVATLQMLSGTHTIGMYASGYLPVKKDVVVLANATRTVTLTTVEEDIVTGNFEITRMTFDEIVAAGIDVYDPANQNVYSATVRVTYGSTPPLTINYVRNDDKIISYTVKDSNGNPVTHYTNSNGESRKITGITYIPSSQGGSDVVAIMDIPAEASYLKEFFDVRLHIVNNASSEFTLEMNEVVLNVPEGMTLMTSVSGDYSSSNTVKIDAIKGQETVTLAWVLRGDKAGEYDLSADFTGTLAEFNELVTARFETEEPIKVYGLEGVKFRILTADEIHNDTLYFNIELENERDIDIYMPSIGLTDKIKNVTESVLHNNAEDDFFSEAYILNAYIQTENGQKQYVPITYDVNGRATTAIDTLAPGQKIVYEYVAYNAINYDGVAYFKETAITEFEGVIDNIETGSFHKELYSFTDYSAKLDAILSGSDADVDAAFEHINTNGNYYYVSEAEDSLTNVCQTLYNFTDLALNGDISNFTQEEERQLIEQIILSILADSSSIAMAEEMQGMKYLAAVRDLLDQAELGLVEKYENLDFDDMMGEIKKESNELASTYITEGEDAFYNLLYGKIRDKAVGYGMSIVFDGQIESFFNDIGISETDAFSSTLIDPQAFANNVIDALDKTQRQAYVAAVLKYECNAEYSNYILDAIISNASESRMSSLINNVAYDLKVQINEAKAEYYDYAGQFYANLGTEIGEAALEKVLQTAIASTPLSITSAVFKPINKLFNFDSFYKQEDALDVYNAMSKTLIASFDDTVDTRNEDADFYSMCILKALCELRLSGEAEFKSFMNDYMEGKYALPLSEETVLKQINGVMNTSYASIDEWYDDVQYNIVHSRDILFNVEDISELETPRAPVVTLDYDKLQTVQTFTSEYEYCFADGVWRDCSNEPIAFEVGVTPSVLRVRKTASDTNLAGKITTVKIYAQKELSKLITVKFDGNNYLFDNLSAKYNYQILFTNSRKDKINWNDSVEIKGKETSVFVSNNTEYKYVIIRSCQNDSLEEIASVPLILPVTTKIQLHCIINGDGNIDQPNLNGYYFKGDSIRLTAIPNENNSFIGWYVNNIHVSSDLIYILEMDEDIIVEARFSDFKEDDIKHSYTKQVVLPTCSDYGYTCYVCNNCGFSYNSDFVEPTGHNYLLKNIIPATTISNEKYIYACSDCQDEYTEEIQLNLENFLIKTVSLSLESSITMNFKVLKSAVADFEYPYVVFNCEGDELTVTDYTEQGDYYVFSYPGISPQLMNDNVKAVLHATHNGIDYTSSEKIMSVRTYAYTMLERYNSDDYAELRTLLVDLLNYGAASQKYVGYQTDNLVNSDLTEEQKSWGTNTTPTFENIRDYNYRTIDNPTSKWVASGLVLNNSVMIRAKFSADNIENKTVVITCGKGTFTYSKDDFVQDKDGNYYVYCNEIFANEMSEEILLTVYDNGVQCSNTMRFSIESYAKLVHDNYAGNALDELTTAMMRYGNSARAYGV